MKLPTPNKAVLTWLCPSTEFWMLNFRASLWLSTCSIQPVICPSLWTGTCTVPKVVWKILVQILLEASVPVRISSLHASASREPSTGLCCYTYSLPSAELQFPHHLLAPATFNHLASLRWLGLVCTSPSCVSQMALPFFYLYPR